MSSLIPCIIPFPPVQTVTEKIKFQIPIEFLHPSLSKHKKKQIMVTVDLLTGTHINFPEKLEHCNIVIPKKILKNISLDKRYTNTQYTIKIEVTKNLEIISKSYSAPGDIQKILLLHIINYVQGLLLLGGPIRLSPLIYNDQNNNYIFNYTTAYLSNPWQMWFCEKTMIDLHLEDDVHSYLLQGQEKEQSDYKIYKKHINSLRNPYHWNQIHNLLQGNNSQNLKRYLNEFSRIIAEIRKLHPSDDYSLIHLLFTAFIEKLLGINGENRYRFSIKISNFLNDPTLHKITQKIYDHRSEFAHSTKYKELKTIYDVIGFYFLLNLSIKLLTHISKKDITAESFHYPNKEII